MFKSVRKPMKESALADVQHGGRHYKGMAIQPVEFGYVNCYDDCAFSVMKYVSRHRDKAGALDLKKAEHFVDLRVEMMAAHGECLACNLMPVQKYINANHIPEREAQILTLLHVWAQGKAVDPTETVKLLKGFINDLRVDTYGEESNV